MTVFLRSSVLVRALSLTFWLLPSVVVTAAAGAQEAPPPAPGRAEATLPLAEILRLHKERDAAVEAGDETRREKQAAAPPVDGVVDGLALRGRIVDQGLELEAVVEVTVLAPDGWVRLPILEVGSDVLIASLSELEVSRFYDMWFMNYEL